MQKIYEVSDSIRHDSTNPQFLQEIQIQYKIKCKMKIYYKINTKYKNKKDNF